MRVGTEPQQVARAGQTELRSVADRLDDAVALVPHDQGWARAFEQERRLLTSVLADGLIALHHIGSTAIPGIVAKPVIDMLAVVSLLGKLCTRCDA